MKLKIPKGQAVNISKIYNAVDNKNLKQRKPKKITSLIDLAEQNKQIMDAINNLKAQNVQFSINDFGKSGYVTIGDVLFDEIAQRDLLLDHIAKIITVFNPSLTSPVFLADVKGDLFNFDTMHGICNFALFCKHGLIKEVDPKNWLKAKYASYTIPNASAGLPAYSALSRNGLGQKKWTSFDQHKTKVGLARQYPTHLEKCLRRMLCYKTFVKNTRLFLLAHKVFIKVKPVLLVQCKHCTNTIIIK